MIEQKSKTTDGIDSAFAMPYSDGNNVQYGLTKREYFAAMAMQGQIAAVGSMVFNAQYLAASCVECADALIDQLNEPADD